MARSRPRLSARCTVRPLWSCDSTVVQYTAYSLPGLPCNSSLRVTCQPTLLPRPVSDPASLCPPGHTHTHTNTYTHIYQRVLPLRNTPPHPTTTMSNPTPAQEEFANFLAKNTADDGRVHPEDRESAARHSADRSEDEEDRYRNMQIESAMRMPVMDGRGDIKLPPAAFDANHATGVKGVIADARSYETARRMKWKDRVRAARRSVFGLDSGKQDRSSGPESDGSGAEDPDEESFLQQWRESRRRELEAETRGPVVRNRRTSPSVRLYGRLDEVDAMGYLDAIEKVGRETVVVVFVYDHEVCVIAKQLILPNC